MGSRQLAESATAGLRRAGVRRLFGLPGGGPNLDLIGAAPDLPFTLAHGETAACVMAGAFGLLTGTPGVAVVTRGPGVTSAANGLAQATLDRAPLLLVSDCVTADQRHGWPTSGSTSARSPRRSPASAAWWGTPTPPPPWPRPPRWPSGRPRARSTWTTTRAGRATGRPPAAGGTVRPGRAGRGLRDRPGLPPSGRGAGAGRRRARRGAAGQPRRNRDPRAHHLPGHRHRARQGLGRAVHQRRAGAAAAGAGRPRDRGGARRRGTDPGRVVDGRAHGAARRRALALLRRRHRRAGTAGRGPARAARGLRA